HLALTLCCSIFLQQYNFIACTGTLESCSATADISIVTVTTPTELSVQAGANVKLPCIFISSEEISTATSVTWSFQQKGSTARPITFLYYSDGKQYNGKNTLFNGRSSWAGNLTMRDASIKIENVQPADNGTYFCDVKNPPDIVAEPGQIKVKVLEEEITVDYGRAAVTPENTIIITKTTTSGNILLNGESFWQLVLQFCCILASFLSNLF
uniref:Ig-like domain-containing protein n=1 Tax=Varanus komodoensis TaxID=61221 RepID=A0A8D2L7B2_VARKO